MHSIQTCEEPTMLRLSLQYFAEGAGDGGGGSAADSGSGGEVPAGDEVGAANTEASGKTYTQEDAAAVARQFHLIPHNAVQDRYRSKFDKAGKYDSMATHMGAVAEHFGVSLDDPEGLAKAILGDKSRIKSKARDLGVSEDVAETVVEAEITKAREAARVRREEFDRMSSEETALREIYSSFDFAKESENKAFKALVNGGMSMKDAYEMTHHAEMTKKAIAAAVAQAKAEALAEFQANAGRPAEGASNHTNGDSPTDVSKLHGAALDAFLESFPSRMR